MLLVLGLHTKEKWSKRRLELITNISIVTLKTFFLGTSMPLWQSSFFPHVWLTKSPPFFPTSFSASWHPKSCTRVIIIFFSPYSSLPCSTHRRHIYCQIEQCNFNRTRGPECFNVQRETDQRIKWARWISDLENKTKKNPECFYAKAMTAKGIFW